MSGTRPEHGWLTDAEKRVENATEGGWFIEDKAIMDRFRGYIVAFVGESDQDEHDAEFIACARTDLPRALALCRTLGEALAAFTKERTFDGHTNVRSHGAWVSCQECDLEWPCPTEQIRVALSEFRVAVGEEPT